MLLQCLYYSMYRAFAAEQMAEHASPPPPQINVGTLIGILGKKIPHRHLLPAGNHRVTMTGGNQKTNPFPVIAFDNVAGQGEQNRCAGCSPRSAPVRTGAFTGMAKQRLRLSSNRSAYDFNSASLSVLLSCRINPWSPTGCLYQSSKKNCSGLLRERQKTERNMPFRAITGWRKHSNRERSRSPLALRVLP
jgi:hypothetical protein